jgi:3-oxoacyl-[acyl-carrier protein] reductase
MTGRLHHKVAIVTGSAMGIGKGIAKRFASEGASIIVADINKALGDLTVQEIQSMGGKARFFKLDVTNFRSALGMANFCNKVFGRIDILCQNVGIYPSVPIEKMTQAQWDLVQAVNLRSGFFCVKACLNSMIRQRFGKIVLTSSITGPRTAIPALSHYAASKAGINGFIKSAAVELAKYNINVNGVEPGTILTEGLKQQWTRGYIRKHERSIPLRRLGRPEDVATAMLFLASDESNYITGQTIIVDGGQTLLEEKFGSR